MTNSKLLWISVMASAALVATISAESALASICPPMCVADVDIEEAAFGENSSMTTGTNETAEGNMTDVQFLAIQNAQSGSLSETNATTYTLQFNNVSDSTVLFSDRPNRIVTSISTADFVGNWTTGPDSFAADAPNDALIVENTQTGQLETAVVESFNPMYDANTNTLTYTIAAENATTTIDLPYEFGQSILIVDGFLVA